MSSKKRGYGNIASFLFPRENRIYFYEELVIKNERGIGMKFVPCNETIYARSDNFRLLDEFMQSGLKCARVEGSTHKKPCSCTSSLNESAKRFNFFSVKAVVRNGEVYLINTSID